MIKSKEEHLEALSDIDKVWDAESGTPEGVEFDRLSDLIDEYESKHFPILDNEVNEIPAKLKMTPEIKAFIEDHWAYSCGADMVKHYTYPHMIKLEGDYALIYCERKDK